MDDTPYYLIEADNKYGSATYAAFKEVSEAAKLWPAAHSAHEAYAILLEELDELWQHVRTKQSKRDLEAMHKEAVQVAAMAIRFAAEVCDEINGRK